MRIKTFIMFLLCSGNFIIAAQPINQKAQVLSPKSTEVSGNVEHRIKGGVMLDTKSSNPEYMKSKAIIELSPYFQFRVGASKYLEYQFRIGSRLHFLLDIYHFNAIEDAFIADFSHELYFENYLKFEVFDNSKTSIALLPQLGVYAGREGEQRNCIAPGYFGISMGAIILFDTVVSKEFPDNRFYWGIPLRFRYNIFDITEFSYEGGTFKMPEVGLGTIRRSFPYGEIGLSFGRHIQEKGFVTRHEVFILWNFCNYVEFQGTVGKNIMSSTWENMYSEQLFTIGYNISFGYNSIY